MERILFKRVIPLFNNPNHSYFIQSSINPILAPKLLSALTYQAYDTGYEQTRKFSSFEKNHEYKISLKSMKMEMKNLYNSLNNDIYNTDALNDSSFFKRCETSTSKDIKNQDNDFNENLKTNMCGKSLKNFPTNSDEYNTQTHQQRNHFQDRYLKRCLLEKKLMVYKKYYQPNPEREAQLLIKNLPQSDISTESLETIFSEGKESSDDLKESSIKREEIASRIRTQIRTEKLANSSVMKARIPNVAGHIIDPIIFHSTRRALRLAAVIKSSLEEFLSWNSPKILEGIFNGLAVSIYKVELRTTRSECKVYYTISSGHTVLEAQKRLEKASPQLRFQLARKLELGYTPSLKFINQEFYYSHNKYRLSKLI